MLYGSESSFKPGKPRFVHFFDEGVGSLSKLVENLDVSLLVERGFQLFDVGVKISLKVPELIFQRLHRRSMVFRKTFSLSPELTMLFLKLKGLLFNIVHPLGEILLKSLHCWDCHKFFALDLGLQLYQFLTLVNYLLFLSGNLSTQLFKEETDALFRRQELLRLRMRHVALESFVERTNLHIDHPKLVSGRQISQRCTSWPQRQVVLVNHVLRELLQVLQLIQLQGEGARLLESVEELDGIL